MPPHVREQYSSWCDCLLSGVDGSGPRSCLVQEQRLRLACTGTVSGWDLQQGCYDRHQTPESIRGRSLRLASGHVPESVHRHVVSMSDHQQLTRPR